MPRRQIYDRLLWEHHRPNHNAEDKEIIDSNKMCYEKDIISTFYRRSVSLSSSSSESTSGNKGESEKPYDC